MMRVSKLPIMIYLEQIIHLIPNKEVFAFVTEIPCPYKFLVFGYYKEIINFEINIWDNLFRFSSLYCLSNESQYDFELNIDTVTANNLCSNNPYK